MSRPLRVTVVDDHPLFRDGVTRTLKELGFDVVAEGSSADDAVSLIEQIRPDLLLLDISMPGGGLATITKILHQAPDVKIVMLTASEEGDNVRDALQLGARGYVLKGTGANELAQILLSVSEGELYVPPGLSAKLIADAAKTVELNVLSGREIEVIDLVAIGSSNKVVARQLGLQEKTVKRHMTSILAKLEASNRTEAALKWQRTRDKNKGLGSSRSVI